VKKFLVIYVLAIFLFFAYSPMVFADSVLSNIGIGVSDKERHAGVNFIVQVHAKGKDGKIMPKPCCLDLGDNFKKIVPLKCYILIKPFIFNEGKIKEQSVTVADLVFDWNETLGGYIIDTDILGEGSHGVQLSCVHRGGVTIYQILIFRFKFPYDLTDENGFVLNVTNPERKFTDQEEWVASNVSGCIRSDGLDINQKPTAYPEYKDFNKLTTELPNVIVVAYLGKNMANPAVARVQVSYGPGFAMNTPVKMTEGGRAEFVVPPGPIQIRASSTEGKVIAIGNVPSEVRLGEKIELKAYIEKGGVR